MRYWFFILLFACATAKKPAHPPFNEEYRIVLTLTTWPIQYQLKNGWVVTEKEYSDVLLGKYIPKSEPIIIVPVDPVPTKPALNWPDRRAIGMVMLANYKEWTGTDNYMNEGIPFEEWIVSNAHETVRVLKDMNSQGMIVWDSEGTKFPRAFTYYGDPRMTPDKVDTFFTIIKAAGFQTGVCLRPDEIKWMYNEQWKMIVPEHLIAASPLENLIGKIEHARKKWGCTLFYVDSNVGVGLGAGSVNTIGAGQLMPAMLFAALHELYPDCLFIPEWHNKEYEPYSALYWHKGWGNDMRGLSVIDAGDTNWSQGWLNKAVKDGHILMGRAFWSAAPELEKIKRAYESDTATNN